MSKIRAKNTGSFDRSRGEWRIKGQGIQVSVLKLSIRYRVTIDKNGEGKQALSGDDTYKTSRTLNSKL